MARRRFQAIALVTLLTWVVQYQLLHGAEVPPEAIAAWQAFDSRTQVGTVVVRSEVRGASVSGDANISRVTFQRDGELAVHRSTGHAAEGVADVGSGGAILDLYNMEGVYSMTSIDGGWLLGKAEPRSLGRFEPLVTRMSVLLALPIRVSASNLYRMYVDGSAEFGEWATQFGDNGEELARFSIRLAKSTPELGVAEGLYRVIVDPSNSYRIVECSWTRSNGTRSMLSKMYYSDRPTQAMSEESILKNEKNQVIERRNVTVEFLSFDSPDPGIFSLNHYGIEHVAFQAEKSPIAFYGYSLFFAALCIAIYLVARRRMPAS